jgi:hypothetical protein
MTGFRSPQEPGGLTGLENRSWYVREKLSHAVAGDQRASAYVCIPKGVQGLLPAVFCHHQHAGTSVWERASSPIGPPPMSSRAACPARRSASATSASCSGVATSTPARSCSPLALGILATSRPRIQRRPSAFCLIVLTHHSFSSFRTVPPSLRRPNQALTDRNNLINNDPPKNSRNRCGTHLLHCWAAKVVGTKQARRGNVHEHRQEHSPPPTTTGPGHRGARDRLWRVAGAGRRSCSRPGVGPRSGARPHAGTGPGNSPARPIPGAPPSRSSTG